MLLQALLGTREMFVARHLVDSSAKGLPGNYYVRLADRSLSPQPHGLRSAKAPRRDRRG